MIGRLPKLTNRNFAESSSSIIRTSYISCGVAQLFQLDNDPRFTLAKIVVDIQRENIAKFAILLFSDAVMIGRGESLAKYITDHQLGSVMASEITTNHNSGNDIQVYVFIPDYEALNRWVEYEI